MKILFHWFNESIGIIELIVLLILSYSYYKTRENMKKLSSEVDKLKISVFQGEKSLNKRLSKFFEEVRKGRQ